MMVSRVNWLNGRLAALLLFTGLCAISFVAGSQPSFAQEDSAAEDAQSDGIAVQVQDREPAPIESDLPQAEAAAAVVSLEPDTTVRIDEGTIETRADSEAAENVVEGTAAPQPRTEVGESAAGNVADTSVQRDEVRAGPGLSLEEELGEIMGLPAFAEEQPGFIPDTEPSDLFVREPVEHVPGFSTLLGPSKLPVDEVETQLYMLEADPG